MKRQIFYFLMMLFALTIVGCSDDDKGIYFTEDEAHGDILTGKQVGIKDNTLNVYTTEQNSVNVQGASGKISATSEDEGIAKVIACDNTDEKRVHVQGVTVGKTKITVMDEKGNSAQFIVNVDDVENAWKLAGLYALDDKKCIVEGVGKEDSAAIAASVIGNDKKSLIKYLRRYTAPDNTYRMIIMDEQKNVLVDGRYNRQQDGQYVRMWITPFKDYSSVVLDQFSLDIKIENHLIWDYTSVYKENYPSVTSVKLYVHFSSLKGL